jgi:hypothetical protein
MEWRKGSFERVCYYTLRSVPRPNVTMDEIVTIECFAALRFPLLGLIHM